MSSLPPSPAPEPLPALAPTAAAPGAFALRRSALRGVLLVLGLLAGAGLLSSVMLWQRLSSIQEQLARQSADSGANAIEARALARQAQEIARDAAARQSVLEARLSEVALQRTQLEDLIQSLSRSRDENLLVDIDSALRLAQQQTQLTGSAEPLLAELRMSEQRLARAAQPRMARVRASIARDIERIRSTSVTDVPALLARLDEVVRQVDDLPVANAVPARAISEPVRKTSAQGGVWWERARDTLLEEARGLVRVSRIDQPDAVLLAPEQATFLRENLKLKLLNVRLSLLARQTDTARADLTAAIAALNKYFDPASRRTQAVATQLQQVQAQVRSVEVPRVNDTLAAIATLSAGK
ncbi:uroporphyrinogen-III C-methyltransferase [Ramlibacter sp. PS3R-8]|uniref:uroporphyrinogen-III C-methyltransferase n=1 Tax=Ramlibacter sp. PS3R-8 TaxID=3133437 RepID=UPI0030A2C499